MTIHRSWALIPGAAALFTTSRVLRQMERLENWSSLDFAGGLLGTVQDTTQTLLDELFWSQLWLSIVLWTLFYLILRPMDPPGRKVSSSGAVEDASLG